MLKTKALYNLLRLNALEDPSIEVKPWEIQDNRLLSLDQLFSGLAKQGVVLDQKSFQSYAAECDTPEDLTELLMVEEEQEDHFYLLIFELWRRLVPEKQSLSIFCDELDHRISLYEADELESDEQIQDALANLLEVLEENEDAGVKSNEILSAISEYTAHDLESFLFDYILDLLDAGNEIYASELVDGFSPYISDPVLFSFLKTRLLYSVDEVKADKKMKELLKNPLDLPFLMEVIRFLSANGEHELFKLSVKKAIPFLSSQEQAFEIMAYIADYYRRLDEDEKEKAVLKKLDQTKKGPIQPQDLNLLNELVSE